MQFDMTKAKTTDFEPLPEGDYLVKIEAVTEKKTDGGTMFLELTLRCENRRIVWDRLYADNPNKAFFVARACGINFNDALECDDLMGKTVSVHVVVDTEGDTPRNRVSAYQRPNDVADAMTSAPVADADVPF
tara:strand:- start:3913 stop:4308 length:396 start_codon:yes stop_codon:yes gene_type:complete